MLEQIVIVGVGQAAVQAIDTLRRKGFAGKLIAVGDEPWAAYQRPPLSKKYLAGTVDRDRLAIRPPSFYSERNVDLRLGRAAVAIDRTAQRVRLDDGSELAYDGLLLTTGSRPRTLSLPGGLRGQGPDLPGVYYLRTIADVDQLRQHLAPGRRLVVVGGGYIGLEVAATVRELGMEVTVLEMADRVMNRVTCKTVSEFFTTTHSRHGVRIVCNATVRAIAADEETGRVRAVVTQDGAEYPADVVIVGIGVVPVDELAAAAGLACANGIVVDEHCRTSDPAIFAAGDCTSHPSPRYGRRLRLESVDNAFEQATSAACNLLGLPTPHDKVPWFWSDQYDIKLVIVGLTHDHDVVITRGDPSSACFSACYLRQGELVAIDSVNSPKDQMAARKLIAERVRPDVTKLTNPAIPLRDSV